ncbi:glycoside-pentoside-hexuronide (GPH):cation symporter [Occultella glacieicola]|uniref:glycoside-pentoside-hexuronide (GPH):cation symporter n=1 Tax=Occultella glacieicola TaxID=2518684 RepID=UPI001A9F716F|nr:glycoside-pentoside-hexuronide (GPH):cation symporter [Occultella glacieicola]
MDNSPGGDGAPEAPEALHRRNVWGFGLGTLGRDMVAAMVTLFLLVYLTEVVGVSNETLGVITVVLVLMRLFDAVNDPVMGFVVDNTRSRWGKFKPWIAVGGLAWAAATVLMFSDWGVQGAWFIVVFVSVYLLWEVAYTVNDISFYGMLPSLSRVQRERERIGVVARVCANVGLFSLVVALVPVTEALENALGSAHRAWFVLAVIVVVIMLAFQTITLVATRQQVAVATISPTPLRELLGVIARNDQLLWVTVAMVAFMTGYTVTTSLGLYYFTYIFGDAGMYSVFAAILGVTQIIGLLVFPLVSARLSRRGVHLLASGLCVAGYVVFLLADATMVGIGIAGVLLFSGQAFIQLLMMLFIADSVEYGQWKLGRRNESVTFSLQPFIYKASSGLAAGVVGLTLILSGVNDADTAADVTAGGAAAFRAAMMGLPILLVVVSWVVLRRRYRLDEATYAAIVGDLDAREAGARPPLALGVEAPPPGGGRDDPR